MRLILKRFLEIKKSYGLSNKLLKNSIYEYNFNSDDEILNNYLGKVMLIGLNLPDTKNLLTETALEKLHESLKKFYSNDDITVAILHGIGGNFCSGIVVSDNAIKRSQEIIEVMSTSKKPIIASLNGHVVNFGFQLAVMCDLKVMEETSLAGFGLKSERTYASPIIYQRLALTVGLSRAMELILSNCSWSCKNAFETNFINRNVSCGAALGQAVVLGQSVALSPLDEIIKEKSKVLDFTFK